MSVAELVDGVLDADVAGPARDVDVRPARPPIAVLLLLGLAFGPQGLGVLTVDGLASLDGAAPVALAILGVLGGLAVVGAPFRGPRVAGATFVEASLTMAAVTAGFSVVVAYGLAPAASVGVPLVAVCAVAAASSLVRPSVSPSSGALVSVAEAHVLVPVVLGGLALSLFRSPTLLSGLNLVVQASCAVALFAVAMWLLLGAAVSETERRVFTVAAVMLVGGAADFLSLSALFGGFVAGCAWQMLGGAARSAIQADISYVRHPFVALVLILAGAHVQVSAVGLALALLYAASRAMGKVVGAAAARAVAPTLGAALHERRLLAPGVFGVAFALNALRAVGPDMGLALDVVVFGTIGTDMLSRVGRRGSPT